MGGNIANLVSKWLIFIPVVDDSVTEVETAAVTLDVIEVETV